jgi:Big-like domain-containing protein
MWRNGVLAAVIGLSLAAPAAAASRLAQWTYGVAVYPQVQWFQYSIDNGAAINVGPLTPASSTDTDLTFALAFADDTLAGGTHTFRLSACNAGGCSDPELAKADFAVVVLAPVDCVVSAWTCGAWSTCDASGTQARVCTRTILTPAANGGVACPTDLTKTEVQACTPPPPPVDTTAPTVSLSVRHSGNSRNYTVTATATDNVAITRVTISIDGPSEAPMTAVSSTTWSAGIALSYGAHTIAVHAYDAAGNAAIATTTVVR